MRATKLAVVLLLVSCGALAGTAFLAEETGKEATGKVEKKKDGRKDKKPESPALAAPAQSTPAPQAAADEPGHVYTNDDLDRLAPPSTVPPTVLPSTPTTLPAAKMPAPGATEAGNAPAGQAPSEAPDPLKQMQDQQAREAERQSKMLEAEQKVASAEARVRDLERQALAVKNPFLARPEIPPEKTADWEKMNSVERLKATEKELGQARKDAEAARADLDKQRSGG